MVRCNNGAVQQWCGATMVRCNNGAVQQWCGAICVLAYIRTYAYNQPAPFKQCTNMVHHVAVQYA